MKIDLKQIEVRKKYCLVDLYENPKGDVIGYYDTVGEVRKAAFRFCEDTDGECKLIIGVCNDME